MESITENPIFPESEESAKFVKCISGWVDRRRMHSEGVKKKILATMFNVSVDNIRRIVRGDTWRYI